MIRREMRLSKTERRASVTRVECKSSQGVVKMQHTHSDEIIKIRNQKQRRYALALLCSVTLFVAPSLSVAEAPAVTPVVVEPVAQPPKDSAVATPPPVKSNGVVAATPQAIVDKARWEARALERARERWKLIVEKRFDDAYSYLTETGRALLTKEQHAAQLDRFGYVDGAVDRAECSATVCTVKARGTITIKIPKIGSRPQQLFLDESWVLVGEEMWLLQK